MYRSVIDDVISNIKPDFDEFGVSEDVLADLQSVCVLTRRFLYFPTHQSRIFSPFLNVAFDFPLVVTSQQQKWEKKVMESRVADFDPPAHHHPAPAYSAPPAPTHPSLHNYGHYAFPPPAGPGIPGVKNDQPEYSYAGYGLAPPRPPPGYTANSGGSGGRIPQLDGPSGSSVVKGKAVERLRGGAGLIPQLDGSSSGSSTSPPPPTLHSAHPSLASSAPPASNGAADDEAINSDLDDSDEDGNDEEDDGGAAGDIMFCTYDKVARVKNKWKCVLKDGMVSIDGRDYLFNKCSGSVLSLRSQ